MNIPHPHLGEVFVNLGHKLASAFFALFLIFSTLNGPKGPPSAPSAQLAFPFMLQDRSTPHASRAKLIMLQARAKAIAKKVTTQKGTRV